MKHILLIATGGTIACEDAGAGLTPRLSSSDLMALVPELNSICKADAFQLMNLDSTNISSSHWLEMAACIQAHYDQYDGFVLTHGTDTMAYTAAVLSYLIQDPGKPIVLTGAQKPINYDSTDSKLNLLDAFTCACSNSIHGVCIVFSGRVILGTRARKTCSKSFAAFSSINYPELANLHDGRLMCYIEPEHRPVPRFYDKLDTKVGLVKMIPGTDFELLDFLLQRKDALVVECFGVGGLPSYDDDRLFETVRRHTDAGRFLVMTTQVQNEGSDLSVYEVGHRLKSNRRVLEAYDMTSEAALAKIMWILGQTRDADEVARLFYTPVAHDILYRG